MRKIEIKFTVAIKETRKYSTEEWLDIIGDMICEKLGYDFPEVDPVVSSWSAVDVTDSKEPIS